jgi:hypothetical protein
LRSAVTLSFEGVAQFERVLHRGSAFNFLPARYGQSRSRWTHIEWGRGTIRQICVLGPMPMASSS